MMRLASVFALLVLVGSAHAQSPAPPKEAPSAALLDQLVAMQACVRAVRQDRPASQTPLDAYIARDGRMRVSGSEETIPLFHECMRSKGYSSVSR
jgi:hypothetical protein